MKPDSAATERVLVLVDIRTERKALEQAIEKEKAARPDMRLTEVRKHRGSMPSAEILLIFKKIALYPTPPEHRARTQWEEGLC